MTNWRNNLDTFFREEEGKQQQEASPLATFICKVALPALEEVAEELQAHGRTARLRSTETSATIIVERNGDEEMTYRLQGRTFPNQVLPYAEIRFRQRKGLRFISVESMIRSGDADYAMEDITQEEVIRDFIENYTQRVQPD
ncbi:MAG: hypothetical protein HQ559_15760 [Lentisphaerae bacterium]|nr:hypothetical protein [Lentisphaerota bacterium]